jgi:hypothetical protein
MCILEKQPFVDQLHHPTQNVGGVLTPPIVYP